MRAGAQIAFQGPVQAHSAQPDRPVVTLPGAGCHCQDPRLATIKAQTAAGSIASAGSGGFGGQNFWAALASAGIESEVC